MVLKKIGQFLGNVTGTVTGEPIKFIGKALNNEYIEEIGEGVKKATKQTGNIVGSLAEGTWNAASGAIQDDSVKKEKGLTELWNTTEQTAKGIGNTVKNTYDNGKDVVVGASTSNTDQIVKGLKGIGKTVAVATIAIGVIDLIDGAEGDSEAHASTPNHPSIENEEVHHIETKNDDLVNQNHPETGVPFREHTVELANGEVIEGVFPEFESKYTATLSENHYLNSDSSQFSIANAQLSEAIQLNPELANHFTEQQLQDIQSGETPKGYTWNHDEQPGKLELVDEEIHAQTGHTGGRAIWGGGNEMR